MNRATRRMMKSKEVKSTIQNIAGDNKRERKQTEEVFEAGIDFALQYYELGTQHKAKGMNLQNFEQFMYFNNLHELDFAKDEVPESEKKKMTEDWVRLVVYPAYVNGYDNVPIFPSDKEKEMKMIINNHTGKNKELYNDMHTFISQIQNDKEMLHQEGMRDSIKDMLMLTQSEFLERHNELSFSNFPDDFPTKYYAELIDILYGAYCGGYKKAEQIPSEERSILKTGQEICDMDHATDFYSVVESIMGSYSKENALYVFQEFQSVIPDTLKDEILMSISQ